MTKKSIIQHSISYVDVMFIIQNNLLEYQITQNQKDSFIWCCRLYSNKIDGI